MIPELAEAGKRLLRRLLGAAEAPEGPAPEQGLPALLDGATAVVVVEALAAAATVDAGGAARAARRADRTWERLALESENGRAALATAMGLSAGGERAAALLSGDELPALGDLLQAAAGRHLPLVVHAVGRALPAHGAPLGTGHEGAFAAARAGWVVFVAHSAGEAVDLALLGRRLAESALQPVLVYQDHDETASALQDLLLPPASLVRRYLGGPADRVESPTPAQRLLFGEQRRRVPRWLDLEQPLLTGAAHGRETWVLGRAAEGPYFAEHVPALLDEALREWTRLSGRSLSLLRHLRPESHTQLAVLGGAAEVVESALDTLSASGQEVGLLSPALLHPLPPELGEALGKARRVLALDRDVTTLGEGPWFQTVRSLAEPGRVVPVVYGLGGLPLRAADLLALAREVSEGSDSSVCLGISLHEQSSAYSHRQALLDALARDYPQVTERGLRSDERVDPRPPGTFSVALHRPAAEAGAPLLVELARSLHALGLGVRARPGTARERFGAAVDLLTAGRSLLDPGEVPAELVVYDLPTLSAAAEPELSDRSRRAVLLHTALEGEALWHALSPALRRRAEENQLSLFALPPAAEGEQERERLLGGLLAALRELGLLAQPADALVEARSRLLGGDESRLAAFRSGLEALRPLHLEPPAERPTSPGEPPSPPALRYLQRDDGTLSSLPRFWNQLVLPMQEGHLDELTPDPYLATGALPPLSSTLRDQSPFRRELPLFEPASCTGCGACWSACPEGALGVAALPPSELLKGALSRVPGGRAEPLRPLLSRLADRLSRELRADEPPSTLGPALDAAVEPLLAKLPGGEARREQVRAAYEALRGLLGELPVAVTEPFFRDPEARERGTGAVLSLAVDPDTCKGCGLCTAACPEDALHMAPQSPRRLAEARAARDRWLALPDTPGALIAQVQDDERVGLLPALLLSRATLLGMAGGDAAEPASGARLALHHALACTEYVEQPRLQQHVQEVEQLAERIQTRLRDELARALPVRRLPELGEALRRMRAPRIDLPALLEELGLDFQDPRLERERLLELVELAEQLRRLAWRLAQGPDGLGRARASLVLTTPAASWAALFPSNPFHLPATVAPPGAAVPLALGLFEAQARAVVEDLKLLHRARVALQAPSDRPARLAAIERLSPAELTDDERRIIPPVLVVGDAASLLGEELGALSQLLESELPVKVLVLDELGFGLAAPAPGEEQRAHRELGELALLGLARNRAFALQSSVAFPEHLARGLAAALAYPGPALLRVHAPSPQRHGFEPRRLLEQARLAVESRAFPLFRYDPSADPALGLSLDLSANPEPGEPWASRDGERLEPTRWAAGERRFHHLFEPVPPGTQGTAPLLQYLELPVYSRPRGGATVRGPDGSDALLSAEALAWVEERARSWRTLQELAGLRNPFTERIRAEVEAELREAHAAELEKLRREAREEREALEARLAAEFTRRLRDGLLALAGYGPGRGA